MAASPSALALRLQPTTVPPGPTRPSRPELRVLEGGRAPSRLAQQAIYRRRRVVAGLVALALAVGLVLLAGAALARFGGVPSATGGSSAAPTVVVQPGDTLWSIAEDIAPTTDVRVTVDRLLELNGRRPIVPGQELLLPG